jgi:predicted ATPase
VFTFQTSLYAVASTEGVRYVTQLTSLRLAGWKSIRDAEIELRPLNILIGANGAGKSNLVSFFKLISEIRKARLQLYIGTVGGAEAVLYYGSKQTAAIEAELRFAGETGPSAYSFRLIPAAVNSLLFQEEKLTYSRAAALTESFKAHQESNLDLLDDLFHPDNPPGADHDRSGELIRSYLTGCQVFHFHDTSLLGPMRRDCPVNANRSLYPDAGNLPAMLYLYRERYAAAYRRIVASVKAVAPFFEDFVL